MVRLARADLLTVSLSPMGRLAPTMATPALMTSAAQSQVQMRVLVLIQMMTPTLVQTAMHVLLMTPVREGPV